MAYLEKRGNSWRARIERIGHKVLSKTFPTKALAAAWARDVESTIDKGGVVAGRHQATVAELFERFSAEVAPTRKGCRWEQVRIKKILAEETWVFKRATELLPEDIQAWRDRRLKQVSGSSVAREMSLVAGIYTYAIKEWRLPMLVNPAHLVFKPKANPSRRTTFEPDEVAALLEGLGYVEGEQPRLAAHYAAIALRLALTTAMRLGEICRVKVKDVSVDERWIHLGDTKNGDSRYVPLSREALNLVGPLLNRRKPDDLLLRYGRDTLALRFRQARNALGLRHLHFHDTRHTAATEMAKKLNNVLELAAVTGHRDLKSLKIYYNPKPKDLAAKLDA